MVILDILRNFLFSILTSFRFLEKLALKYLQINLFAWNKQASKLLNNCHQPKSTNDNN